MIKQGHPSDIVGLLDSLSEKLTGTFSAWEDVAFIGVRSGGEFIARALVGLIREKTGNAVPLGVLDITLYRDDISKRRFYPEVRSTDIPFSVDDKDIILVDDVLHTGRSVRAAIDQIVDLGRPRRIYLMVLFDRGGRELPIQADFVGKHIELPDKQIIKLDVSDDGASFNGVVITEVKA
ncbi:MAG: bifunctional pyr operon transcriptional regulator/uracil phosphoribosyltransferase PyrR [Desulfomonilia bacterium]|nr:bifunctional pyr operon transcriptional regulator/uracil phosphoribosyltransferase PyrR [Desulfomonilia bacterium]